MATSPNQDDQPIVPGADPSAADPLAVFRRSDLPAWALVRQRLDPTEIDDVATAVEAAFATVRRHDPARPAGVPGGRQPRHRPDRGGHRGPRSGPSGRWAPRSSSCRRWAAMAARRDAGQLAVLAALGVDEASIGCQIRSSLDTVRIGEVAGIPVFIDRHAHDEADVIVPINRVKPHTDFSGPVESGLLKMIAIGLGNQRGRRHVPRPGLRHLPRADPGRRRVHPRAGEHPVRTGPRRERPRTTAVASRRSRQPACSSASRRCATRPMATSPGCRSPGSTSWSSTGSARTSAAWGWIRTSSVATTPDPRAGRRRSSGSWSAT